jgi:hypothetical protein
MQWNRAGLQCIIAEAGAKETSTSTIIAAKQHTNTPSTRPRNERSHSAANLSLHLISIKSKSCLERRRLHTSNPSLRPDTPRSRFRPSTLLTTPASANHRHHSAHHHLVDALCSTLLDNNPLCIRHVSLEGQQCPQTATPRGGHRLASRLCLHRELLERHSLPVWPSTQLPQLARLAHPPSGPIHRVLRLVHDCRKLLQESQTPPTKMQIGVQILHRARLFAQPVQTAPAKQLHRQQV